MSGSGPKRDDGANSATGTFGAEDGTRTRDPHLGKVMLYQLSHFRRLLEVIIAALVVDLDPVDAAAPGIRLCAEGQDRTGDTWFFR